MRPLVDLLSRFFLEYGTHNVGRIERRRSPDHVLGRIWRGIQFHLPRSVILSTHAVSSSRAPTAPPKERTNPRRPDPVPSQLSSPYDRSRSVGGGTWRGNHHKDGVALGHPAEGARTGWALGRECPLWAGTLLRKRLLALEVLGVGRLGRVADIWIAHLYPDRSTCRQEMNIASKPKNSSQRCVLEECIFKVSTRCFVSPSVSQGLTNAWEGRKTCDSQKGATRIMRRLLRRLNAV